MDAWLRSIRDFSALDRVTVLNYELPVQAADLTATGTLTVVGELEDYTGHWAVFSGRLYAVKKSSVKSGKTTLTLGMPESAFDRSMIYFGTGEETWGGFISRVLTEQFSEQSDAMYAMPYLHAVSSDATPMIFPLADGEIFSFGEVLQAAADEGIRISFSTDYNAVNATVRSVIATAHTVFTADGRTQVKSLTVSKQIVAKVTVQRVKTETVGEETTRTILETATYYWNENGTISADPPAPRISGDWMTVEVSEESKVYEGAASAMAANEAGYKIEFWSGRRFQVGDTLTMRIGKVLYKGVVTLESISSGDKRSLYRIGSLPVTLTEQLAAMKTGTASAVVSTSNTGGSYVPASITHEQIQEIVNS